MGRVRSSPFAETLAKMLKGKVSPWCSSGSRRRRVSELALREVRFHSEGCCLNSAPGLTPLGVFLPANPSSQLLADNFWRLFDSAVPQLSVAASCREDAGVCAALLASF